MGNQACPCKGAPTPPVCQKIGSPYSPGAASSSSARGPPPGAALDSLAFSPLDFTGDDLEQVAFHLLSRPFGECGGTDVGTLRSFVRRVQCGYLPNVFHGFHHAVDVLQMLTLLGPLMPWEALLSPAQRFALAVAALALDIGHPGFSNVFLVEACDELAVRYNDVSPLENMHCSKLFEILQAADAFGHLPRKEMRLLRKLMIDAIMHTDAACHEKLTEALDLLFLEHSEAFAKGLEEGCKSPTKEKTSASADDKHKVLVSGSEEGCQGLTREKISELTNDEHKALLAVALLHTADVSYACRPWSSAYAWSVRAQEELFLQGDQEQSMGLPVQLLHDRRTADVAGHQLGFIHTVVAPLVAAEVRLFRAWHELASSLATNTQEWAAALRSRAPEGKADVRAEEVRVMLDSAMQGRPGSKSPSGTGTTAEDQEPCSEPSCEAAAQAAQAPLVREVRRWQEQRLDGQTRELILLYVASDAPPGDLSTSAHPGQPILFRYAIQDGSEVSEASFGPPAAALLALDANFTPVESQGFDGLLSSMLEKGRDVTTTTTTSEDPKAQRRRRKSSIGGFGQWLQTFGGIAADASASVRSSMSAIPPAPAS